MASYYVHSGAAGAGTGADWANAYTTLVTALVGKVAGDIFYIAHDHAESAASITLTSPGTSAAPCFFYCVNRAGSVPPVAADLTTGATFSTTSNGNLTTAGNGYFHGLSFTAGNSSGSPILTLNNTAARTQVYKNCAIALGSTGAGAIHHGNNSTSGAAWTEMDNCTYSFANIGSTLNTNGTFIWKNTASALLGTIPTTLFGESGVVGTKILRGVDLSAAGSGKNLFTAAAGKAHHALIDCKLDASVTVFGGTPLGMASNRVDVIRSGATGINYGFERYSYAGTQTIELTIVRTGGASNGTTAFAWKIITTADAEFMAPFECPPIAIWNDVTGSSVTATVEGIWGGASPPNDDEIWVEVQYLGSVTSPLASFVSDAKAVLDTAAAQTASSETWGGSTTDFKLGVSFTPQQKGWIYAVVKCAKVSSTFYIDPKVTLS